MFRQKPNNTKSTGVDNSKTDKFLLALVTTLLVVFVGFRVYQNHHHTANNVNASSAMITNLKGNSGGTGVVLSSSDTESIVLTNSHVCHVVENGGMVHANGVSMLAEKYKRYTKHDLCLIAVQGNLGANTWVSNRPPVAYQERATVSGHPMLYPNVVTNGYFSGQTEITIVTGVRECTDADRADANLGMLCAFAGGIPTFKTYESQLVTATISPGSSGSGVYNSDGGLSNLAFAGQGSLGYGWTVPYAYVRDFLDKGQFEVEWKNANAEKDITILMNDNKKSSIDEDEVLRKIRMKCQDDPKSFGEICSTVLNDAIWNK